MTPSLSIVIPALNEAARLPATLLRLRSHLEDHSSDLEVIVVDDGSDDGTAELATAQGWDVLRVIRHPERRGKGAAVCSGVMAATRDWVLMMDADMAIPIEELDRLWPATADAPLVIGSKRMPGANLGYSLARSLGSRVGHLVIGLLVVRGFNDTQCGFKLLRRDVARQLFSVQQIDGFGFDFEILHLARRYGVAVREVPVVCRDRGDGSIGWSAYARTLGEALRVAWRRCTRAYPASLPSGADHRDQPPEVPRERPEAVPARHP